MRLNLADIRILTVGILALCMPNACAEQGTTQSGAIQLPDGFTAQRLYVVPESHGSWVSIAKTPRQDVLEFIVSDQYGKLYEVALSDDNTPQVTPIDIDLGSAQGLLCAFDALYVVVNSDDRSGLYRVTRRTPQSPWQDVEKLMAFDGSGEHGPHAVILSPTEDALFVCAGNHTELPALTSSRVPRRWQEDLVLDRIWDPGGHAVGKMAPGGWICKISPDGKECELYANGFRNEYDIAFNRDGELFTFDADMEWDMGTSWYRPTRILHVTSGSEFGWRGGTGKWPAYYPDSLPSVVDCGPGSPTGISFAQGDNFPPPYRDALFAADWSRGRILAIHMQRRGASYTGSVEPFAIAQAFPVTDLTFHDDGCLYFLTGGRRLNSALYRIRFDGLVNDAVSTENNDANAQNEHDREFVNQRRQLERFHHPASANPDEIWSYLGSADRHVRFAARVALEHIEPQRWQSLVMREPNAMARVQAILALARTGNQTQLLAAMDALDAINSIELAPTVALDRLRAYGLLASRFQAAGGSRSQLVDRLQKSFAAAEFPTQDRLVNRELASLLALANVQGFAEESMAVLENQPSLVDRTHYLLAIAQTQDQWNDELLHRFFQQLILAKKGGGGKSYGGYIDAIALRVAEKLNDQQRQTITSWQEELANCRQVAQSVLEAEFVKQWTLPEVRQLIKDVDFSSRDVAAGKQAFVKANCFACHQVGSEGGAQGPTLTTIGSRFSPTDLLVTIMDPNREISDQYANYHYQLKDEQVVTGRIVNLSDKRMFVATDMYNPGHLTEINADEIEQVTRSQGSAMPTGLLSVLTAEEILDLMAYLVAQQ